MSKAAPLIIIFVILGGIVAWGAMTDWTFSGLLPRKGAKCTPEEGDEDENAAEYIYDEDEECTVVNKCKTEWEPNTSNTACEYSKAATECTPTGTPTPNGKYTFDEDKLCKLTSCENDFKLNSANTACDECIDGYTKEGTVCRKCEADDVTLPTSVGLEFIEDVVGQTYKTENGNCIPNRMLFDGNNGTVSCDNFCAGYQGGPWPGPEAVPPEWKGAKCVGVTNGDDYKTMDTEIKCETVRGQNQNADHICICERDDTLPWVL